MNAGSTTLERQPAPTAGAVPEPEKRPASLFRVRFQDCDPFGHLYNGRYLDYIINAREEHLREYYGLDLYSERFRERNWLARSSRVHFISPAKPNRLMRIQTALLDFTRTGVFMEAVLTDPEDGRLIAVGWANFTYVDLNSGRPARHESELMELFASVSLGVDLSQAAEKERLGVIKTELKASR